MSGLTRRELLRLMGYGTAGTALGGLLGACGPAPAVVEKIVTQVVEVTAVPPATLDILTQVWMMPLLGAGDVARIYSDDKEYNPGGVRVNMTASPDEWQVKAIELSRREEMPWDGYLWAPTWIYGYQFYVTKTIQPIDQYLQNSKIPWAKEVMQPGHYAADTIWPAGYFDGKPYQIPSLAYSSAVAYYVDLVQEVGYERPPGTWDEFTAMARKIKQKHPDITPIAYSPDWLRTPGSVHATFTAKPYDDSPQQLTKINDPAMWEAMELMRSWFVDELCSWEMVTAKEPISQYWERKRAAVAIEAHRWVRAGQHIHGAFACQGMNLPVPNKGDPPRTWMTVDGAVVFSGSKHPQETVDFLLACQGPRGASAERYYQGGLASEGAPLHYGMFDQLVPKDSENYWVRETYEAINNSVPAPLTGSQNIMLFHFRPYLEKMLKGEVPIKQGCQEAQDGIRELVTKFQQDAEKMLEVHE